MFHAIDLPICNSRLEYKRDDDEYNIPKAQIMDLLHFKMNITHYEVKAGKAISSRKRDRLSITETGQVLLNVIFHLKK